MLEGEVFGWLHERCLSMSLPAQLDALTGVGLKIRSIFATHISYIILSP